MMNVENVLQELDEALVRILSQWDKYTTSIATLIVIFFAYQVFARRDPDTHPMMLARQSQSSPVRQPGESAVYRSHSSPHGMELNTGLNVRDPDLSRWARGRDGDLRDIWRRVVNGPLTEDGKPTFERGHIFTYFGSNPRIDHDLSALSAQLTIIGQYIKQHKGRRIALYLPNSVEFLVTLFACAFYELTPVLLPFDQPASKIIDMLKSGEVDSIIATVGTLQFDIITAAYPGLENLIWVVDEGSRHMDWNEVPKGTGGAVNVATWQDILEDGKYPAIKSSDALTRLPPNLPESQPKNIVAFWQSVSDSSIQMVEYSHKNLVSAISAQLSAIPAAQRITKADTFFPADSLSTVYTLVVTLAALYYNASLALNSVANSTTDLTLATQGMDPTIILANSHTLANLHDETAAKLTGAIPRLVHWFQTRSLIEDGVMPNSSIFTSMNDSKRPPLGKSSRKVRLIFMSEQVGAGSAPLSSATLSDLRIYTGARIIYALTAAKVAGAVTQTQLYDYRVEDDIAGKPSHFGVPLSSVEILLKDPSSIKSTSNVISGEIIARGPAVVGGEAALGVNGRIRIDNTLAYAS